MELTIQLFLKIGISILDRSNKPESQNATKNGVTFTLPIRGPSAWKTMQVKANVKAIVSEDRTKNMVKW